MRNSRFAKDNETFKRACIAANVKATTRQASKFRMKKGIAYKVDNHLAGALTRNQGGLH